MQVSSRLIPGSRLPPGFDDVPTLSTRYQRFSFIRLHSTYLTWSCLTFSLTLTTMAFVHSSLRWFEASTCMAAPRGLPSSLIQHVATSRDSSCLVSCAFVAHSHLHILPLQLISWLVYDCPYHDGI